MNLSITYIKQNAFHLITKNLFQCILASFISGIMMLLVFDLMLDGTTQLQQSFDINAFYESLADVQTYEQMYDKLTTQINNMINSVGFDMYMTMLKRFILATMLAQLLKLLYNIFVMMPFQIGNCAFYLKAFDNEQKYSDLFKPFKTNYLNVVKIQFLKQLKVILWSFLFIIPGIIKAYEYYMVPFLVAENPDISSSEAFRLSREIMEGNKLKAFMLNVSFIGWLFASLLTRGFLFFLFVNPYMDAASAYFAQSIKKQYSPKEGTTTWV